MTMQITRSNYALWFIDMLDGNLSDNQVVELDLFLSLNPDLKEEFDELSAINLSPVVRSFPNKLQLKKTTADITESQFEYLCISFLEKEISAGQRTELMEIIEQDSDKKRTFELIQKTKLTPEYKSFKNKRRLLKRTLAQKVIRLSVIALSSAAAITLIVMTKIGGPHDLPLTSTNTAQNTLVESPVEQSTEILVKEETVTNPIPFISKATTKALPDSMSEEIKDITTSEMMAELVNDETESLPALTENKIKKIPVIISSDIITYSVSNTLIASNATPKVSINDDDRSNVSRFISKTFRERILKEEIYQNTPIKGYEIAEVGVNGLNKLLGWEMALDKNNDENGELRSVYFSSKILKFNAPVKKSEPSE